MKRHLDVATAFAQMYRLEFAISAVLAGCLLLAFTCTFTQAMCVLGGLGPVLAMSNVADAFKQNHARKNVIVGGAVILVCITLLSCVSSFMIYREGFTDLPSFASRMLALFAVIVVEGAFIWLVFGFTRAFASGLERLIALAGMGFLVLVMLCNIVTHFMMVKNLPLNEFQAAWLSWGAVSVFIAVLLIVLAITLADPVARLIRLELRYQGKQQETILQAKNEGLNSDAIQIAMAKRANYEAARLVETILGEDDADYRIAGAQPQPRMEVRSKRGPKARRR